MTPVDPTALLTALGLGKYAASIIAFIMAVGYIIAQVMPYVTAPAPTAPRWWRAIYQVLNFIAGNYLKAASHQAVVTGNSKNPNA